MLQRSVCQWQQWAKVLVLDLVLDVDFSKTTCPQSHLGRGKAVAVFHGVGQSGFGGLLGIGFLQRLELEEVCRGMLVLGQGQVFRGGDEVGRSCRLVLCTPHLGERGAVNL